MRRRKALPYASSRAASLFVFGFIGLSGCVPGQEEPVAEPVHRTHYTLREGKPKSFSPPLPTRTDYYVDWHYSDGHTEELKGFHAWDFLAQGRYSMVEVLDESGHPVQFIYDFDGDGRTDLTLDAPPKQVSTP